MGNRDGQADKVALTQTISLVQASEDADYVVLGTEIDTQEWDEIAVVVEPSRAVTASDDLRFVVQSAPATGGTFTALADAQKLPTYKADDNFAVIEATSPYAQVFGFTGAQRFVKIGFNGVTIDTSNIDLVCTVIGRPAQLPAYDLVDSDAPSDSLP